MTPSAKWDLNSYTNAIFLAPMEGVVDHVVRELWTAAGGIDVCTTEFIRVSGTLLPDHVFYKYAPELKNNGRTLNGTPVFIQLLGSDPLLLSENALKAVELGAFGIDLNFGCPAKRVNQHDGGANLLKTPDRIHTIVSRLRNDIPQSKPLTVKVRLGFDNKDYVTDIADAVCDGGADALIVHARTKEEGYRPPAHWHYIAKMKEQVNIPVVANGEIWNKEDYALCRQHSECEHVMVGRGLIANSGLALQLKTQGPEKTWLSLLQHTQTFMDKSQELYGDAFAVRRVKQLTRMMAPRRQQAQELFDRVKILKSPLDIRTEIQKELDK